MMSIKRKMALWMAVAVFAVTAVFCSVTYLLVRNMLISDFNRMAVEQFLSVANTVKVWTDGDIYVDLNPTLMTGFAAGGDRAFVVRDVVDRTLIAQSISLDVTDTTISGLAGANPDAPVFGSGFAPNGAQAVVVTQIMPAQWGWDLDDTQIETAPGVRETVVEITLALDRTPLTNRLRSLGWLTISIAFSSAAAAAVAALFAIKAVLRPLDALTNRASGITELTHDQPFPVDGPQELRPIAERLNDLLVRLADASLVERRFTADAAHELRTPIAELRTLTDVALRFPTAPEQLEKVIQSSNDISVRLTSLIDALLGIARKDAMASTLQMVPVDPPDMIRQNLNDRAAQITQRGLSIDLQMPDTHRVTSDETLLHSILQNLIGNAVSHAPKAGTVQIRYEDTGTTFRFVVSNAAPDMDAADLSKVFEPFWRKGGQKSEQNHAGLGLALSKGFADILGLDLVATLSPAQDFEIILQTRKTA